MTRGGKNVSKALEGNKNAEVYTIEEATEAYELVASLAMTNDECYSMQDAYIEAGIRPSTYYYLIEKFPVLESLKKDAQDYIIARVNKGSIKTDFNATASIWRMKQLGEADKTEVTSTNINIDAGELSKEEAKKLNSAIEGDY